MRGVLGAVVNIVLPMKAANMVHIIVKIADNNIHR